MFELIPSPLKDVLSLAKRYLRYSRKIVSTFVFSGNQSDDNTNNSSNHVILKFSAAAILVYVLLGVFAGLPNGANLGAFVVGLVILFLGIAALMGFAWYALIKPLPGNLAPSRKLPLSHGLRQGIALFLLLMSAVGIAGGHRNDAMATFGRRQFEQLVERTAFLERRSELLVLEFQVDLCAGECRQRLRVFERRQHDLAADARLRLSEVRHRNGHDSKSPIEERVEYNGAIQSTVRAIWGGRRAPRSPP
jgi:hypothetical protein